MLTKYYLEIDGVKHDVPCQCIKNWDEIKCVYKRADFSGVTRSFTSQFEFVGEFYDKLIELYLRDGVNAKATLTLMTITDRWEWEEQFTSDLDFASITWDNYIVKINCIDDSLASSIKARNGTKYEFVVGQDIPVRNSLLYDRITMRNSCVHEIQGECTNAKYGDYVDLKPTGLKRLSTYIVGSGETYENNPILYTDQTEDSDSAFIEAVKDVEKIEIEFEISTNGYKGTWDVVNKANIYLISFPKGNESSTTNHGHVFQYNSSVSANREYLGLFPTFEALKRKYPNPQKNVWALVGSDLESASEAYITPIGNIDNVEWIPATIWTKKVNGVKQKGCSVFVFRNRFTLTNVKKGQCYALFYECDISNSTGSDIFGPRYFLAIKSKIQTSWTSKAPSISIDSLTPTDVCKALLGKVTDNKLNVDVNIADTDSRIAKSYLFAAESIRDIPGAKFYTSFSDFCGWLETVFGYTYYLGPRVKAPFKRLQWYSLKRFLSASDHLLHTKCPGGHSTQVVLIEGTPYFAVLGDDYNVDKSVNFYTKWEGSEAYNDPETGMARKDTIFYDEHYAGIYFDSGHSLMSYPGDINNGVRDSQSINFVPRNSLFAGNKVVKLPNIRDLRFTINSGIAYSTVTAGYDKQEYEAECGRDEWNFSAQYNTGIDIFDKALTLSSKYRADCYGFELLSQDRSKDTTDNKSDNTVFFAYCALEVIENQTTDTRGDDDEPEIIETTTLYIDRSGCEIRGALSDDVFNGEYSPYHCVLANAKYIAAALCPTTLKFASSDGNSNVSIDGIPGNSDIQLNEQLFSLGEVDFSCPDVDAELDVNALYEVESNGVIYCGFLKEVSLRYANNEVAKYKLIVKDIEL